MKPGQIEGIYAEGLARPVCLGYIELMFNGKFLAHSHFSGGQSMHTTRDDAEESIVETYTRIRPTLSKYDR